MDALVIPQTHDTEVISKYLQFILLWTINTLTIHRLIKRLLYEIYREIPIILNFNIKPTGGPAGVIKMSIIKTEFCGHVRPWPTRQYDLTQVTLVTNTETVKTIGANSSVNIPRMSRHRKSSFSYYKCCKFARIFYHKVSDVTLC